MNTTTQTEMELKYYTGPTGRFAMRTSQSGAMPLGVLNWLFSMEFLLRKNSPLTGCRRSFEHLNSTSGITDDDGDIISRTDYTAFGEVRFTTGSSPTDYTYTGQRYEEEVGVSYYVARWYDSTTAHFIQADSLIPQPDNAGDWDRYAYVLWNPISFNDPTGHWPDFPPINPLLPLYPDATPGIYLTEHIINNWNANDDPEINREIRDQIGGQLVIDYQDVISSAAENHNVSFDLIAGIIRHESGALERRLCGDFADFAERIETLFHDASIGIGQMQVSLAEELEANGYVTSNGNSTISNLLNPEITIDYIAGNLQYIHDTLVNIYGNAYINLDMETQQRLILTGYNTGVNWLLDTIGPGNNFHYAIDIDVNNYTMYTYDDYHTWKDRMFQ